MSKEMGIIVPFRKDKNLTAFPFKGKRGMTLTSVGEQKILV
jgi:hypothetical protein